MVRVSFVRSSKLAGFTKKEFAPSAYALLTSCGRFEEDITSTGRIERFWMRADPFQKFKAAESWHFDINNQDLRQRVSAPIGILPLATQILDRLKAVLHPVNRVFDVVLNERPFQQKKIIGGILDHKDRKEGPLHKKTIFDLLPRATCPMHQAMASSDSGISPSVLDPFRLFQARREGSPRLRPHHKLQLAKTPKTLNTLGTTRPLRLT